MLDVCNVSIQHSSCTEDVMFTYEALKVASQLTFPFCINRTRHLFCEALSLCNDNDDDSAVQVVCEEVRQEYCTAEWRILEVNIQSKGLVDCYDFGETSHLNCSEQFDLADNNSVCLPVCTEFSQHQKAYTDAILPLNAFVHLVNVLGGIIILIASLWNKNTM